MYDKIHYKLKKKKSMGKDLINKNIQSTPGFVKDKLM